MQDIAGAIEGRLVSIENRLDLIDDATRRSDQGIAYLRGFLTPPHGAIPGPVTFMVCMIFSSFIGGLLAYIFVKTIQP
jgi:hypothetical protein